MSYCRMYIQVNLETRPRISEQKFSVEVAERNKQEDEIAIPILADSSFLSVLLLSVKRKAMLSFL